MKKCYLIVLWILMASGLIHAQFRESELYVVPQSNGDQNLVQVEARYQHSPMALYLTSADPDPLSAITQRLAAHPCQVLHLYVSNSGDKLIVNTLEMTPENINSYAVQLKQWRGNIKRKIVIHNLAMGSKSERPEIIGKFQSLCGVPVEVVRYY